MGRRNAALQYSVTVIDELMEEQHSIVEFRERPEWEEWFLLSTARGKRPHDFAATAERPVSDITKCPFEEPRNEQNSLLVLRDAQGEWQVAAIRNIYPAVNDQPFVKSQNGIYPVMAGTGNHEVVVLRDHTTKLADLASENIQLLFQALIARHTSLQENSALRFISLFENYGARAGASLTHPHCQIIAIPIVPDHIRHRLNAMRQYFTAHQECSICAIIRAEQETKTRIVAENDRFIVLCPFASRIPFELIIYPKHHTPHFTASMAEDIAAVADMVKTALHKLDVALNDPDYNMLINLLPIHTDDEGSDYFHWSISILPKTAIWAGFELETDIDINTINPDDAAAALRAAQ